MDAPIHVDVTFPGGVEVAAHYRGHSILTDQPRESGGSDAAPSPFDLFMASLAACAGFYALRFCQQRDIDSSGLGLTLDAERDERTHMVSVVRVEIALPAGFPDRYRDAIVRAVDQCTVKRHLLEPPRFEIVARSAQAGCVAPSSSAGSPSARAATPATT